MRNDQEDKYPTLHFLGLGFALDELERVCEVGRAGKYANKKIDPNPGVHIEHAAKHLRNIMVHGLQIRDQETHQRELAHAAVRLLMALATFDKVIDEAHKAVAKLMLGASMQDGQARHE